LIRLGDEAFATAPAAMPGRSAFDHPPPKPGAGDDEIEHPLHTGGWPDGLLLGIEFDVCAQAGGAFHADDHEPPVHTQLLVARNAGPLLAALPGSLPGPNVDVFPLVVEAGTTIDEGVFGMDVRGRSPLPAVRQPVNLVDPGHPSASHL